MTDQIDRIIRKKNRQQLVLVILVGFLLGLCGGQLGWMSNHMPFPDGNPGNVTCKGSYTVSEEELAAAGDLVVATVGDAVLTNRQLQIYYWMAVEQYLADHGKESLDMSRSLEFQACNQPGVAVTWQQYFLQQALDTWHHREALRQQGQSVGFTPGECHQTYLDTLGDLTGGEQQLLEYAQLLNLSYMFFTEEYMNLAVTEEDVEAYINAHPGRYPEAGYTVDIRHILLLGDADACMVQADDILSQWRSTGEREYVFAQLAAELSADTGSANTGGLYADVAQGNLHPELDAWCFDPERRIGDYTVIQTEYGCHILYYRGDRDVRYAQAEYDMIAGLASARVFAAWETHPMTVDYQAIVLGAEGSIGVTDEQLLYPDVGHERYTDVPWYYQDDYPDVWYGRRTVAKGGCGPTCLAMAASYLTDTEYSPAVLAPQMRHYSVESGSAWVLFDEGAATLGITMPRRTRSLEEVLAALENGHVVVSIQREGLFTEVGHYILLTGVTEDGKIMVQDPARANADSKNNVFVDGFANGFSTGVVHGTSRQYWIFGEKQVRNPICSRCGDGTDFGVFAQNYFCGRCLDAQQRRDLYLTCCA